MIKLFYLCAAVVGAVIPWYFNIRAVAEVGDQFTPYAFFMIGFQGSAMLGSVAADFWIGATVSIVWMIAEGRRLKMPYVWLYVVVTFVIAWACALPLFLYFRERHLQTNSET
jgi:hypothetical protein